MIKKKRRNTRQKGKQKARLESEEEYLNILEELPDIVYKIDPDGYFTFINNSIEMLGYKPEELIGKHFSKIIHPDDIKSFSRHYVLPRYKGKITGNKNAPKLFDERRTGKRKTKDLEIKLITKKRRNKKERIGTVIAFGDVSSTGHYGTGIKNRHKKFLGTLGIIRDITERKHIEEKIAYQANLLQEVSDAIISTDLKFNIRTWNKAAEIMYGWEAYKVIGKPVHKVTKLEYPYDEMNEVVNQFFKSGYWRGEVIQQRKDGTTLNVLASVVLLKDSEGNPIGALAVNRDITDRKKTEEKLHNTLNELKDKTYKLEQLTREIINAQEKERLYLASEIHDDLLQGIVAILYFFQTIDISSLDKKTQERKDKLIELVRSSIDKGRTLISEIEPVRDPEIGIVSAVQKSLDLKFATTNIKVKFDYPREIPAMDFATKTNILRIIQEALMNIYKHAKATKVTVKMSVLGDELEVEIRDNGVGFVPDLNTKTATGHIGLLSMQERARLIGGEITIKGQPGKGTTVKGIFPLKSK